MGHEFANSIQYIAIANYFEAESLKGLAKLYTKQAEEEHEHAMKFVEFLLDTGSKVVIPAIPAPQNALLRRKQPRSWRWTPKSAPPARSMIC